MKNFFYLCLFVSISACSSFGNDDDPIIESTSDEHGSSFSDDIGFSGDPTLSLSDADPYAYLNLLRSSAGLVSLSTNTELQSAATNHVGFLVKNGYDYGHNEVSNLEGFTGVTPTERVKSVGYKNLQVGEGISVGISSVDAIDSLMSAIYHRFDLLDVKQNEIGMSFVDAGNGSGIFVHNIGNKEVNALCAEQNAVTNEDSYLGACNPDFHVSRADYDAAFQQTVQKNPTLILWPPPGTNDIPPAFFEESPDPLSDYSVSGNPISVQFNPGKVSSAVVSSFLLFDTTENSYVSEVRLMDMSTDPNNRFSDLDFALFPLKRLAWDRTYRVEIEYTQDGVFKTRQWTFSTRSVSGPMVKVAANESSAVIESSIKTYLYFEPKDGTDTIKRYESYSPDGVRMQVSYIDQNTLVTTFTGDSGDSVELTLNESRVINLRIR